MYICIVFVFLSTHGCFFLICFGGFKQTNITVSKLISTLSFGNNFYIYIYNFLDLSINEFLFGLSINNTWIIDINPGACWINKAACFKGRRRSPGYQFALFICNSSSTRAEWKYGERLMLQMWESKMKYFCWSLLMKGRIKRKEKVSSSPKSFYSLCTISLQKLLSMFLKTLRNFME